ncbi:MAG: hypothetical protein BWY87_00520 [Deltaproteobacteria bacterium ADurb.Bin510]|nr:MAG: hypothetical protein BWY87_00520 [Deltaproteobacteria bacterium ADurb.Bin510]
MAAQGPRQAGSRSAGRHASGVASRYRQGAREPPRQYRRRPQGPAHQEAHRLCRHHQRQGFDQDQLPFGRRPREGQEPDPRRGGRPGADRPERGRFRVPQARHEPGRRPEVQGERAGPGRRDHPQPGGPVRRDRAFDRARGRGPHRAPAARHRQPRARQAAHRQDRHFRVQAGRRGTLAGRGSGRRRSAGQRTGLSEGRQLAAAGQEAGRALGRHAG